MQLTVSNQLIVHEPDEKILAWAKTNLALNNPEYANKVRMGLWTGNTPRILYLYSVNGNDLILPFGCLKSILPLFNKEEITGRFPYPIEQVNYGKMIELYDYQSEAVTKMVDAGYGILQAPAGCGKTQMGLAIIQTWGKRALWLTHTKDLLDQSRSRALRYMDKSLMGEITEGRVNIGIGITFATVQTMHNLDLSQYADIWDVVIVDECHRVAGTPTKLTMFGKVLGSLRARHKYGLSATVHRADGLINCTYAMLGNIEHIVPDSATKDRVMKVSIQPVSTSYAFPLTCYNYDGTIKYAEAITDLAMNEVRNSVILWDLADNNGHSMLILSSRLSQLKYLFDNLPADMQKKACMIDGKMTNKKGKAAREQALEDMRTGKKQILFATYGLAKEGLDIPRLDRLFMATPEKDYAIIIQSIGRIARTCEGKRDPIVYDYVDNCGMLRNMYRKRLGHYRKTGSEVLSYE